MRKIHWFVLAVFLLFPVIGISFYPFIPEYMATHWSFGSDFPDDYMNKLAGLPLITMMMIPVGICLVVNIGATNILIKYYNSKKLVIFFDCFTVLVSVLFLTVYIAVLVWNAGANFNLSKFMLISVRVFAALILAALIYALAVAKENQISKIKN